MSPGCTLKSSIGKKAIMAITGLLLFGFVLGHLLGNLLIFMGPDALNAYAKKLRSLGPGLWVLRFGLLTILAAHVISAIQIVRENRAARPSGYAFKAHIESTYAGRTMMVSGLIVLVYIVYHILHFTVRVTHPDISNLHTADGHHDVYSMVVLSFQQPLVTAVYLFAMALLCMHLSHGLSSLFQTLGLNNERRMLCLKRAARGISLLIFIGYSSIPASIFLGLVTTSGGSS